MDQMLAPAQSAVSGFIPHGFCYLWNWRLLTLHVVSDGLIGLSYVVISAALTYLVFRVRRLIPFSAMFIAFGVFIIACGFTHFVEILTLWQPAYWFSGSVKAVTALASVVTAALMPRVVPVVIRTVLDARAAEDRRIRLAAAVEANAAKSQFMATMSHELRTPLNAIIGYAELLENQIVGPVTVKQRHFLARVRVSASHLMGLISEVLDFERIEAGRDTVHMERVEIGPVLHEAVELLAPIAESKHLHLTKEIPTGQWFVTDVMKVRQIAVNLLSNAVKYTVRGEVSLRAAVGSDGVLMEVRDTGIGISPTDRPRIFDPFWQADQSLTRTAGGAGLGLSIVDRFARSLGGSVRVESEVGTGTTVSVLIPHGTPRPAAAKAPGLRGRVAAGVSAAMGSV